MFANTFLLFIFDTLYAYKKKDYAKIALWMYYVHYSNSF